MLDNFDWGSFAIGVATGAVIGVGGVCIYNYYTGDDDKKSSADAANSAATSQAVDPRLQATPAVQQGNTDKAQVVQQSQQSAPNAGAQPQAGAVGQNGASAAAQETPNAPSNGSYCGA